MPEVEVEQPQRQRDERVAERPQPSQPADREQRLQHRPGQARGRSAGRRGRRSAGAGPCGRRRAPRRSSRPVAGRRRPAAGSTGGEADLPPGRHRPAAARQRRAARGSTPNASSASRSGAMTSIAIGRSVARDCTAPARATRCAGRSGSSRSHGRSHQRQRERIADALVQLGHVLEVHPVDAGDEGGHGDDRRPGGDAAHDLVLLDPEQRQVRLEDRGQQLALGVDLLVDPPRVVGHVAEVAAQARRLWGRRRARAPPAAPAAGRRRGGTRSPRA